MFVQNLVWAVSSPNQLLRMLRGASAPPWFWGQVPGLTWPRCAQGRWRSWSILLAVPAPVEQEQFLCTGCSCSVSADFCRLLVKFPELNYQLKIKVCIDK